MQTIKKLSGNFTLAIINLIAGIFPIFTGKYFFGVNWYSFLLIVSGLLFLLNFIIDEMQSIIKEKE